MIMVLSNKNISDPNDMIWYVKKEEEPTSPLHKCEYCIDLEYGTTWYVRIVFKHLWATTDRTEHFLTISQSVATT